ncbi:MAG: hydantoin racemase [Ramlibacter sp.]|jgi:allantoin racemase|nr:hydantoin racemase [Ramlibacter sp.]
MTAGVRLLVVNANTSEAVTRIVAAAARAAASEGTHVMPVTAAFGVPVIQCAADHDVAYRACIDAVNRNVGLCDAVLVAVSLDTAVEELQRTCNVPVVGMTGAALATAEQSGRPVGVLTIGETMRTLFLERFGANRVSVVQAIDLGPDTALGDRENALELLRRGTADLARQGMEVIVPMGATVAGLAARIQPDAGILVLDSVACGVRLAERLARDRGKEASQ